MSRAWQVALYAGVALNAACASAKVPADTTIVPSGPDTAFSCAMREINTRGYVVRDARRDAGLIRGERASGGLADLLTGVSSYDELTLTVYADHQGHALRVVADGYEILRSGDAAGGRVPEAPTARARRDASEILQRCGTAPS